MDDVLYLAWKYLAYHRIKTGILVGSIALILYLPIGLNILINRSSRQLNTRAATTPLLVGAKGSPLELVLRSLYFESDIPADIPYAEAARVEQTGLARAIPLHIRFQARNRAIVGTALEYFSFRQLQVERGRLFGRLGECVLGAEAARQAGVQLGDTITSTPQDAHSLAGVYPLKMQIVGVLRPAGTPDDRVVFVDVKTAWVIAGLAHGHEDLRRPDAQSGILREQGDHLVANASVMQYNEITPENVASFHFHGDPGEFPVTSVIVIPTSAKSNTLLQGRYLRPDEQVQIVDTSSVMEDLLKTILTVRRYFLLAIGVVAVATVALLTLVFLLSLQLRRREFETITKIGGSRARIVALVFAEATSVIAAGAFLATVLSLATAWFVASAAQWLVRMA